MRPSERPVAFLRLAVLVGVLSIASLGPAMDVEPRGEEDRLRGTWVERALVTATTGRIHEKSDGRDIRWEFKGKRFVVVSGTKERPGKFVLNPSKSPKEIDLIFDPDPDLPPPPPGGKAVPRVKKGVYEFDGDELRVCLGEHERPGRFAAEGEHWIYELTRER